MTTHSALSDAWTYEATVDSQKLEQFATSIAALATNEATPLAILENVLSTIAENLNASSGSSSYTAETILKERAAQMGFDDVAIFRREMVRLIGKRVIDLEVSKLSAFQRQMRAERQLSA